MIHVPLKRCPWHLTRLMFTGWSLSFLTSLSLWWDLDPSWRKCSLRPHHNTSVLLCVCLPEGMFPLVNLNRTIRRLWREWVSSVDSSELPAPLLKAVVGKGWNSLLGPSLGSAEGSCSTASAWGSPGTWALTEEPTNSSSGLLPWALVASPPAGTLGAGPDNGQGRRGLPSALWGGTRHYSVPPLWDRMRSEFLKGPDARMVPRMKGRWDFWKVSRRKIRVVNGQPK